MNERELYVLSLSAFIHVHSRFSLSFLRVLCGSTTGVESLDRHRLGEVAGLVHVAAAHRRNVIGEKLKGHHRDDRSEVVRRPPPQPSLSGNRGVVGLLTAFESPRGAIQRAAAALSGNLAPQEVVKVSRLIYVQAQVGLWRRRRWGAVSKG